MSNGESKIAIFKAALCYGFAIALRALFIGDSVMLSEAKHLYAWNLERFYLSVIARGASLVAINEQRIPIRLIASLRSQ